MEIISAWIIVILGLGHTAVGVVSFKKPLVEAMRAGFVGQFAGHPGDWLHRPSSSARGTAGSCSLRAGRCAATRIADAPSHPTAIGLRIEQ